MRSTARCFALLPLLLLVLARPAHADPMDEFNITGGGVTINFSLAASTTGDFDGSIGQVNFGTVSGTVNGVTQTIDVNFITGSGCADCDSVLVGYGSTSLAIGLPSLYQLTPAVGMDQTFTFLPGTYMTGLISPPFSPFEINVTAQAAATPEPPTLFLFAAAALGGFVLIRQRRLAHP